jgi:hypothetical protein
MSSSRTICQSGYIFRSGIQDLGGLFEGLKVGLTRWWGQLTVQCTSEGAWLPGALAQDCWSLDHLTVCGFISLYQSS